MLNKLAQDHYRAFKTALNYLLHAPLTTGMSLIAMGICLALPLSLYLFIKNIQQFGHGWDQHTSMTLYVEGKSSLQQVNQILLSVKKYPFVKRAQFISPETALEEFENVSHMQNVLALLNENPLPGAITVELDPKKTTPQELEIMKQRLSHLPKVMSVSFDFNWVEKLQALLALGKALTHFLYILIGLGVILVVSNTIRLALERHRDEIEVLTLVGATYAFIRRPFLYRGILLGILAGTIAILILGLGMLLLRHPTEAFVSLFQGLFKLQGLTLHQSFIFLVTSAVLGGIGAHLAFTQQRAMITKNEYTRRR
jgi:cell division transport system permease protein